MNFLPFLYDINSGLICGKTFSFFIANNMYYYLLKLALSLN